MQLIEKKLSVIIPVYYNAENLMLTYKKISETVLNKFQNYELILVDDGSQDTSWEVMQHLKTIDNNIKLVKLSRNFGSIVAQYAGFQYATGDCVTVIAADLQDPPAILMELYKGWEEGYKVSVAVRVDRQDGILTKFISNLFYKIMRKYILRTMPIGGFDCFLIDKVVVEIINKMEEKNSSIVGQILWCGFKVKEIPYVWNKREIGTSRWTFTKKVKYFVDSMLSFSYFPIRLIIGVGLIFSLVSGLSVGTLMFERILYHIPVKGWTSLMCLTLLSCGLQLFVLGVIGEYIWRSFDAIRKRPLYIVEELKE